MTSVMWFRKDLRLSDNKALAKACAESDELILFFQVNPKQFIEGSPNHQAFFSSLAYFKKQLDQHLHLQIHFGNPIDSLNTLIGVVPSITDIYFNTDETGYGAKRDQQARNFFKEKNITIHESRDGYLHGAEEIKRNRTDYYKVYTPYYKKWIEKPKEAPIRVNLDQVTVKQEILFEAEEKKFTNFLKTLPKLDEKVLGEKAAKIRLNDFLEHNLTYYEQQRDLPESNITSHLSRYLRTGEISVRTIWKALQETSTSKGKTTFEKELCWRDFYHMIYVAFPNQKEESIQKNYRNIEWENNRELFKKWQKGQTGYPIIDAAMRQLNQTGWMHNRLRMITASFLTKDLLIDWRWGEKYFQQMLHDYDPASNIGGWQWAASTGTDAVPYFRIFNPTIQSEKFDKDGNFIREFVPELRALPPKWIHQPENMPIVQQKEYNVMIGKDYPCPIVNHKEQRKVLLAKYESSKENIQ
ncbi:cryptochrome/photolyase family protein [Lactococcus lactis]|uniref:cryptochrome/photolyase family protein n=1 Tax=Lactococcus lactis TaxID=1358 RepID=UPI001F1A1228|nr:deoxyribodipyrimidine photo-lyase [Lactococcus lactis]MCG1001714.1 DNA photolyase family protein [Lactococcus lactis]